MLNRVLNPLIFDFPHPSPLGDRVREKIRGENGKFITRSFPDGETYLRVESSVAQRNVIINASLVRPNDGFLNLLFLADTLRSQKAKRIGLLAPYLAYMRQDKVFQKGEALTSKTFATLLSAYFDELITIDPHLHRYHTLSKIYSIPTTVLHAAPLISQWIHKNVQNPFVMGPDAESVQWVKEVANDFPFIVLNKVRHADGHVEIAWPSMEGLEEKTPVLVDDIISSGGTLLQAIHHLKSVSTKAPLCVAIHPIFAGNSYEKLREAGVQQIVTCNTIPHVSNHIDVSPLLASALKTNLL